MGKSRDLDTYQPSVKIDTLPQVDVQSPAQQLINSFSQFGQTFGEVESQVGRQFVDQQRMDIRNQIARDYAGFAQTAMSNPDKTAGLNGFNQQSDQYAKGMIGQQHFWNKQYTQNMLDYFANEHRGPLLTQSLRQNNLTQKYQLADSLDQQFNQIFDTVKNSNTLFDKNGNNITFAAPDALMADTLSKLEKVSIQNGVNPSVYEKSKQNYIKKYTTEKILRGAENALNDGNFPQFLNEYQRTNIPGLSDQEKLDLLHNGLQKVQNQYALSLGISTRNVQSQITNEIKNVSNGMVPNAGLAQFVKNTSPPEVWQNYQNEIEIAKIAYDTAEKAKTQNPLQAAQDLEALKSKLPSNQTNDALYINTAKRINAVFKDFYNNPMGQTSENPAVKDKLTSWENAKNVNATGTNFANSTLNFTQQHPDYAVLAYQESRGLSLDGPSIKGKDSSVRFLDNKEADQLVTQILQGDPMQVGQIFQKLKNDSATPAFYMARIKQLVKGGLDPALADVATLDLKSPLFIESVKALRANIKDYEKIISSTDKKSFENNIQTDLLSKSSGGFLSSSFNNYIASQRGVNGALTPDFMARMDTELKKLSYYFYTTGMANTVNNAYSMASNVIAGRYNYAHIYGNEIRIPNEYTTENVVNGAKVAATKIKDIPWSLTTKNTNLSGAVASQMNLENIVNGHFINDGLDHGLVWADVTGKVPRMKNGEPYRISFEEAEHSQSIPKYTPGSLGKIPYEPKTNPKLNKDEETKTREDILKNSVGLSGKTLIPQYNFDERETNVHDARARGIRNNNPGNIKKTETKWTGEIDGDDKVFKTFKTKEDGIKALGTLLNKYSDKGINTIERLISKWSSTDQTAYINHVAKETGINPEDKINLKDKKTRGKIANAIIAFENGNNPYGENMVMENI